MFYQKLSLFWWLGNIRYFVYFLRELSGVIIVFSLPLIALGIAMFLLPIAFAAAIFHTITWFWVTIRISPLRSSKILHVIGFLVLIGATTALSYFLLPIFYAKV